MRRLAKGEGSRVRETRERMALKLITVSFFAVAAWVMVSAVRALPPECPALLGWS